MLAPARTPSTNTAALMTPRTAGRVVSNLDFRKPAEPTSFYRDNHCGPAGHRERPQHCDKRSDFQDPAKAAS
jgi:hypothetical protein